MQERERTGAVGGFEWGNEKKFWREKSREGQEQPGDLRGKNKMIMIDEHIPKHQVSVNKVKGCVKPKEGRRKP